MNTVIKPNLRSEMRWNEAGLIPVIVQDFASKQVLMMAWMNSQAFEETLTRGEAVYWSRSRQQLWHKGEQSGCTQPVRQISLDCDGDTLLLLVEQRGKAACHTGRRSCFFLDAEDGSWRINQKPVRDPEELYGRGHG